MKKQPLFKEFSPVSATQWKEKILHDLKGKSFDRLISHPDEGFDIQPFYQQQDLQALKYLETLPGRFPFVRGKNSTGHRWHVNQVFHVKNPSETNAEARKAVENGADSLTFWFHEDFQPEKDNLSLLFSGISPETVQFHFRHVKDADRITALQKVFPYPEKLSGSVENDPLAFYTLHGFFNEKDPFEQMVRKFDAAAVFPALHAITVDGTPFHNAGGTMTSEMAFTLSVGSYYMQLFTDKGFSAEEAAGKMLFRMAVGSDYFMEIAKFRAFRYLWAQILKAFGVPEEKTSTVIHAENSYYNKTVYDPYVNMLRTTTETMAAILGGADIVTVLPFDTSFENPSEMAKRIARNQQLILREESYFGKVSDPAAGSYYIENLTARLIEKSWDLFLEIDSRGGYLKAFEKGFVQQRIEKEARKKDADVARRKISILGVNQFPNTTEHLKPETDSEIFEFPPAPEHNGVKPLRIYRAAVPFEKLRYATDRFSGTHRRPQVWLFTIGDLAMRRARAQFAENFFGCAGYSITDHDGFSSAEEGIAAALKDKPEIVVLCSDDETYEKTALQVFEALKNKTIVVLAGYPKPLAEKLKAAGMEHFIHVRSNMLEDLQKFNRLLGIP